MKTDNYLRWASAVAAGAVFLSGAGTSQAQIRVPTNNFVFNFDTNAAWWGWYGPNPSSDPRALNNNLQVWDGTMDANNNPSSGSCKITLPFNYDGGATPTLSGAAVTMGNFALDTGNQYYAPVLYNGRAFARLTAKIRVAPGTPLRGTNNDFGTIQFSLLLAGTPNGGNNPFGTAITIPAAASNSWVAITQTVNQLNFPYEVPGCMGIVFNKSTQGTANSASQYPSNPFVFWIDDVRAELATNGAPDFPPPRVSLARSDATGLSMSPLATGNNVRALLRATNSTALSTWWMNNPQPVTYSMGIAAMPANGSFQAHIFLNPDGSANTAPDFADPNNIFLDIRRNADGSGFATFHIKTNEPAGNAMTYFQGAYAAAAATNGNVNLQHSISTTTALGTWGLTFQSNTNITMFGPGGVSTNFGIPPVVAAKFLPTNSMVAYFGDQNNATADGSLAIVLTNATIKSGSTTIINDNFPPLYGANQVNPTNWARQSGGNIAGIAVVTTTGWRLSWTTADFGFGPQWSTNLTGTWLETDSIALPTTAGTTRSVIVPYTLFGDKGFFRLEKRKATKLLVLLPGETFAPGTATGKTGTPTVQTTLTPFSVRVIPVTDQFKRAGGLIDTVQLVDASGAIGDGVTGLNVANVAMVDSVATFNVMFVFGGTTTVTASDITDPTKANGVSSSLTGQ